MLLNLPMAIGELSSSKVGHDILRCVFLFIDHFLCQGWLYRPLSFRIIDCRAVIGIHQSYRVGYQRIRHRLVEVYLFRDAQLFMLLQQSQQSVFIFLRHILSTIISLSLAIWVLSTALLVLYFFHKMYFPSIHCISGIVLTISSTSSSFITDLQAVLLMALAISLILTGTLK